jgi:hypothetical protein
MPKKKKKMTFWINPEDKKLFKDVVFLVDASYTEHFFLWKENFHELTRQYYAVKTWEDEGMGHSINIGEINKRPVCVTLFYTEINGHRVMFYEGTSQVVDHKMIERWLQHWTLKTIRWDNGHRWAHSDAMNFHHCIDAIQELNDRARMTAIKELENKHGKKHSKSCDEKISSD